MNSGDAFNELAQATLKLANQVKERFDEESARTEKLEKNPLANFVHIGDDGQAVLDASMLPTFDVIVRSSDAFRKMEEALSQEMAKVREMDDILAGVVRHVGYTSPAKDPLAGFPLGKAMAAMKKGYLIDIDPKASPSGIPFSVALEYLKAGRRVSLPEWRRAWIQTHPAHGISFHRGYDDVVQPFDIRLNGGFNAMLSSDWMVLPESTK